MSLEAGVDLQLYDFPHDEWQQGLKALGYLSGSADGDFGPGTERAVIAFQEAQGYEANGILDGIQQVLLESLGAEELVIEASMDPKAQYAVIADKVSANMEPLYESGMTLEYDAFEGTGFISDGKTITKDASGAADIDQAVFTLKVGLKVEVEGSAATLTPVMMVSCLCARRPVMQNLALKAGETRVDLPAEDMENSLSGARSVEKCTFTLDEDALNLLSAGEETLMRIEAKYQNYDIPLTPAQQTQLKTFCELVHKL